MTTRFKTSVRAVFAALALGFMTLQAWAAAPMVIEAEKSLGTQGKAYHDTRASGQNCAVLLMEGERPGGELVKKRVSSLPAGDYLAVAYVEVYPVHLLHTFAMEFKVGGVVRKFGTIQFDPAPGYQKVPIRFVHSGGPLDITLSATGVVGFDGVRHDNSEEEKAAAKAGAGASGTVVLSDKQKKAAEEADGLDLAENPPVSKLQYNDNRVICDKIELVTLSNPAAVVAAVEVDKVHYLPTETVKATAKVNGLAAGGAYQFVAEVVTEADSARQVYSADVTLAPGKLDAIAFQFPLDPKTEFGHELRCSLRQGGATVHSNSALFGVSTNVYRIGITGSGGPQNKALLTAEESDKIHRANKDNFANYFELFAWAPSDFSDMTPDTERWWSGQTMYPGSLTGFKNFFSAAKKYGVKSFSYGSIAGGGIAGYESFRKFPGTVVTSDGVSQLATYFLERSWHKEYSLPLKGSGESISWQFWSELWASGTPESIKLNVDEIVGSAEQIGWDGVRWDFWWTDRMAQVKKMVAERRPGFIWGYNTAFANPGSKLFLPNQQASSDDFHEIAKDHGLIMDESVREWSHTNYSPGIVRPFYEAICREANYIKRIGGLPLFITFDMGSRLDLTFNVLCGLAGGQRYTYMTSPGDFAYGPLPRFLTRFSAYVWDDTAMIASADKVVSVSVGKGPKDVTPWYDQSVWLRKLPDGKQQLLVNLLNPVGNKAFCNRVQPPPATLKDVAVGLAVPSGAKVTRAFQVSPDLVEGLLPLELSGDAGNAKVVVPEMRAWTIVVFELAPAAGGELAYPAVALTTPVEDAKAYMKEQDEKKARAEQEKNQANKVGLVDGDKAAAAPAPAPAKQEPFYFQFDKSFNGDAAAAKAIKPLVDMNIRRDGVLDVHHVKGPFCWRNPIEQAAGLVAGGRYGSSYIYRETFKNGADGYMNDFPETMAQLLKYDVLVVDNVHSLDLGPRRRAMIAEYVRNGGSLLFLSGYHTLSMGYHHNTALEEVLPVKVTQRFAMNVMPKGEVLEPAKKDFFLPGIDWAAKPMVCYMESSALKEGAEVLATVGGKPAIVASTFGKGRVVTFLINHHGDFPKGSTPYFEWNGYVKVLASCVKWLAEDAGKTYVAKPEPAIINEKEVLPSNLAVEAALLEPAEFTKRLRSAQKNMVDAETARTLLEAAIENVEKIDDPELLGSITSMAEAYVDASFTPLARKLLASQHAVFKRVGLQVLGLTGDKTLRAPAEDALSSPEVKINRAALIALGRIGDPASIPAIKRYLAAKPENLQKTLALAVLVRLGDKGSLENALAFYPESTYIELATKAGRMGQYHKLTSGTSFKLTPMARKQMTFQYELTLEAERAIAFDNRYFADSLQKFTDEELGALIAFFSAADTYRVAPLAYTILSRLPAPQAEKFRKGLANAATDDVRVLATP